MNDKTVGKRTNLRARLLTSLIVAVALCGLGLNGCADAGDNNEVVAQTEQAFVGCEIDEMALPLTKPAPPAPGWTAPVWSQPPPARCTAPLMPPGNVGWAPHLGLGCKKWLDYCAAGVGFGCNAYFFCMTAGNNAQANCARACIQSNIPAPPRPSPTGDVDPRVCQDLKEQGLDCECLYYREAACIDACKARRCLPWGVNPTLDLFWPSCGGSMNLEMALRYVCPKGPFPGGKTCEDILNDISQVRPTYPCSVTIR